MALTLSLDKFFGVGFFVVAGTFVCLFLFVWVFSLLLLFCFSFFKTPKPFLRVPTLRVKACSTTKQITMHTHTHNTSTLQKVCDNHSLLYSTLHNIALELFLFSRTNTSLSSTFRHCYHISVPSSAKHHSYCRFTLPLFFFFIVCNIFKILKNYVSGYYRDAAFQC